MFWWWHLKHLQHVCLRLLSPQDFPDIIIEEPFSHNIELPKNNYLGRWSTLTMLDLLLFPSDASVAEQNCFTTTALMLQLIAAKVPSKTVPMALLLSDTLAVKKFSVIQLATFRGETCRPWYVHLALTPKMAKQKQLKRLQKRPLEPMKNDHRLQLSSSVEKNVQPSIRPMFLS